MQLLSKLASMFNGGGFVAPPAGSDPPSHGLGLVTGVDGSWGRALALALESRGHPVLGTGTDQAMLARMAPSLDLVLTCDPSDDNDVRALRDVVVDRFEGRLDVVALGCSTGGLAPWRHTRPSDILRSMEESVLPIVRFCQALVPLMIDRGRGTVVVFVQPVSPRPNPMHAARHCSALATRGYLAVMRRELAGTGVRLCRVFHPRHCATDATTRDGSREHGREAPSPERLALQVLDALERGAGSVHARRGPGGLLDLFL